jgi:hypothetical protein
MVRRKHVLLPPWSDYFVAAVDCLKARGGSATIEELEEDVAEKLRLSEQARTIPHGDGRRTQFQYDLGSGLIDHSQKMTVAAMQIADKNVWAHRS